VVIGSFRSRLRPEGPAAYGPTEHREAQCRDRAEFYAEYSLHVCAPLGETSFPAKAADRG
jgi:hypothetical protein